MRIIGWDANPDNPGIKEEEIFRPLLEKFRVATPKYPLYATFLPKGRIEEIKRAVEKGPWLLVTTREKAQGRMEAVICMGSVEKTKQSEEQILLEKLSGEETPREITHLFASVCITEAKKVFVEGIWYA